MRYERPLDCLWTIVGEPGWWIRVDLYRLPPPCSVFFLTDNSSTELKRSEKSFAFPPVLYREAVVMWIQQKCRPGSQDVDGDSLWLDLSIAPDVG